MCAFVNCQQTYGMIRKKNKVKGCRCMKLKMRLIIAFITVITLPVFLTSLAIVGFGQYQIKAIEKTYGITGTTYETFSNPTQIFNRLTEASYHELTDVARCTPAQLEDATYLETFNKQLLKKNSYLLVRKEMCIRDRDVENVETK